MSGRMESARRFGLKCTAMFHAYWKRLVSKEIKVQKLAASVGRKKLRNACLPNEQALNLLCV